MGYLPEALVNYLALLGWGAEDGKTETFTLEELTQAFSLERVTPSPAIFDFDKLNWLNRHYLKQAEPERLATLSWGYFSAQMALSLIHISQTRTRNTGVAESCESVRLHPVQQKECSSACVA